MNASRGAAAANRPAVLWYPVLVVGIAGLGVCGTLLYKSMAAVLEVGGSCGSGGFNVVAVPCPDNAPLVINVAIWGGLIALGLTVGATHALHAPSVAWLAWPGLFLTLGYNFLHFGLNPPGGGGTQTGWIVCAVLFGVMGVVPLVLGVIHFVHKSGDSTTLSNRAVALSAAFRNATTPPNMRVSPLRPVGAPTTSTNPPNSSVVADLERLATLHTSGNLDDAEYQAAKQRLLGGPW